jgi:hypothetical protein
MIFGSESAGAKNESNRRTEPNRDAECVGESLYAPLGRADSSWAISESERLSGTDEWVHTGHYLLEPGSRIRSLLGDGAPLGGSPQRHRTTN